MAAHYIHPQHQDWDKLGNISMVQFTTILGQISLLKQTKIQIGKTTDKGHPNKDIVKVWLSLLVPLLLL